MKNAESEIATLKIFSMVLLFIIMGLLELFVIPERLAQINSMKYYNYVSFLIVILFLGGLYLIFKKL